MTEAGQQPNKQANKQADPEIQKLTNIYVLNIPKEDKEAEIFWTHAQKEIFNKI